MSQDSNPIWTLISTFGLMSLFAVGGANAAIPEMHRIAVEVNHWMTTGNSPTSTPSPSSRPGRMC